MSRFKTFLFDLDGTLTDPGTGITNSVAHAYRHYGLNVPERTELYKYIGPPLIESFMKYCDFPREKATEAVEVYREYFSVKGLYENEVYEGIPELLDFLRGKGGTLVLATSKPYEFSVEILKHFDLYKYFDFVAAATMDEKRTEKHDVIEYAFENIGSKSNAVMTGDRMHDIRGAKLSGIPSVGVLYGYGSEDELRTAGADYLARNVEELKGILLGE